MQQILQKYYSKMGKDFVNAFSEIIPAIMSCLKQQWWRYR